MPGSVYGSRGEARRWEFASEALPGCHLLPQHGGERVLPFFAVYRVVYRYTWML